MKYHFISANEDLDSGLLGSQFLGPITRGFSGHYHVFSINRPFFKRYRKAGVKQINLLIPPRLIAYNLLCLLYLPWALVMAAILRLYAGGAPCNTRFVARGYLTGLICFFLNRVFGFHYLFDPRSLYPLECLTAKRLNRRSLAFSFWMWVEWCVVGRADSVICVSGGMDRYYRRRYGCQKCVLIPCFNSSSGSQKTSLSKEDLLAQLNLSPRKKLLIYFGSLNYGWNNIHVYHRALSAFDTEQYQVLLVTQDEALVKASPLATLPNVTIYSLQSLPGAVSIADCFQLADFGLVFMSRSRDWFTRLSVKFAEYTAQGLPVIANKWVGEAAYLIRKHRLPGCYVINTAQSLRPEAVTAEQRRALANWAQDYFSPRNINRIREVQT